MNTQKTMFLGSRYLLVTVALYLSVSPLSPTLFISKGNKVTRYIEVSGENK